MRRDEKKAIVDELAGVLKDAGTVLLTDFTGMDVAMATELRKRFREASIEYRVVKNTLARRAAHEAGMGGIETKFTGPTGLVLADKDPAAAAKILAQFERQHATPKVKAGWVDMSVVGPEEVRVIADLPPRDVLLAQIGAGIMAPVSGFARLLGELLRRLVSTIDQVAKSRE